MMANYTIEITRDYSRVNNLPQNLELLTKDSKIKANRVMLRLASPVIDKIIMESPGTMMFDFKNHSGEAVSALLQVIYHGKLANTNEKLKDELLKIAEELEIQVSAQSPLLSQSNFKRFCVKPCQKAL